MKTPFFDSLIDDFGIWQHSNGKRIFPSHGYALDDAARGFIVCLALNKKREASVLFDYLLSSRSDSEFYGFATDDRRFFRLPSSDDAKGQVIWAMGYAYHLGFRAKEAHGLMQDLRDSIYNMQHMRGHAYALLGALYVDKNYAEKEYLRLKSFFQNVSDSWPWPEPVMTYGNGMMAYAFLRYCLVMKNKESAVFGRKLLEFIQHRCEDNRILGPIGNNGWLPKGSTHVPDYSQQPIDVAYMIWAWVAAYELTSEAECLVKADQWMDWFEGKNIKYEKMYDPESMKCYDGIDESGIHHNSGAESNICFLLSKCILDSKKTL